MKGKEYQSASNHTILIFIPTFFYEKRRKGTTKCLPTPSHVINDHCTALATNRVAKVGLHSTSHSLFFFSRSHFISMRFLNKKQQESHEIDMTVCKVPLGEITQRFFSDWQVGTFTNGAMECMDGHMIILLFCCLFSYKKRRWALQIPSKRFFTMCNINGNNNKQRA